MFMLYIILRAIRAGRCRERRYADHLFIQIYFRMHHFLRLRRQGGIDPLTKILRTFLLPTQQSWAVLGQNIWGLAPPLPFLLSPLPSPFPSLPLPSIRLEVGPLNTAKGSEGSL